MFQDELFYAYGMVFGPIIWFFIVLLIIYVTLLTVLRGKVPFPRVCHFGMMLFVASLVVPLFGMLTSAVYNGPNDGGILQVVSMVCMYSAPFLLAVSLLLLGISLRPKWEPQSQTVRTETKTEKPKPVVNPFD